jgi:hypothetical protein
MSAQSFECTFRHVAFVLVSICLILVALFGGIAAALAFVEDGGTILSIVLYVVGTIVVLLALTMASAYATHSWTIEPTGIRIEERPKIPFLGLTRRRLIAFADIAALRNVESGLDSVIEIATRDGNAYRVMAHGEGVPALQAFAAQIATASTTAGHTPLAMSEGLSFWNRPFGLAVIVVMLIFTTVFAAAALFALFDGGLTVRARSGEALAIVVLLPFGAAYLLYKSLTRRWRVLKLLSKIG